MTVTTRRLRRFGAAVVVLSAAAAAIGPVFCANGRADASARQNTLRIAIDAAADSLDAALVGLNVALANVGAANDSAAAREVQRAYAESRSKYKRLEAAAEFHAPALAAALSRRAGGDCAPCRAR